MRTKVKRKRQSGCLKIFLLQAIEVAGKVHFIWVVFARVSDCLGKKGIRRLEQERAKKVHCLLTPHSLTGSREAKEKARRARARARANGSTRRRQLGQQDLPIQARAFGREQRRKEFACAALCQGPVPRLPGEHHWWFVAAAYLVKTSNTPAQKKNKNAQKQQSNSLTVVVGHSFLNANSGLLDADGLPQRHYCQV